MLNIGTHHTLSTSLETIGAAFAIFEMPPDSPSQAILVTANSAFEEISGRAVAVCIERPLTEFLPRYLEKALRGCLAHCLAEQEPQEIEIVVERSGTSRWWRLVASPLKPADAERQRVIATLVEITERKLLEQQLEIARQRFEAVVENGYDAVITVDEQQSIKLMNEAARYLFGVAGEDVIGTPLSRFIPARFHGKHTEYMTSFRDSPLSSRPMESRSAVRGLRTDGTEFPIEVSIAKIRVGNHIEMTAVIRDISERARLIDELSRAATHDSLTGIFNRRLADSALKSEISRSLRFNHAMTVALFDLDRFKQINDTFGHACGDRVLQAVAKKVAAGLREIDVFCRWGGEEFLVVLPETTLDNAAIWAERTRALIAAEPVIGPGDERIEVTASFGLATLQRSAPEADDLITRADHALYRAKQNGRNLVVRA
ncbi:sensor domain-containing diguanylate cyclase [Aromatoleum sp.]|uniref:sensor domain-containing diguanylate cyclase n=1 Tax=Aromatoleum sp. TaxID=2307007 RepID=UPI002FCB02DD